MRYLVLNQAYWDAIGYRATAHYNKAMRERGWIPDWFDTREGKESRRGLGGKGPSDSVPLQTSEDRPKATPETPSLNPCAYGEPMPKFGSCQLRSATRTSTSS